MDVRSIIDDAQAALDIGARFANLAAGLDLPGVSPAAKIAAAVAEIVQATLEKVEGSMTAATTEDEAELRRILSKIRLENDGRAAAVDAS